MKKSGNRKGFPPWNKGMKMGINKTMKLKIYCC